MKSILVALNGTPAAKAARQVGLSLAEKHAARLTGICVLDVKHLTAPEPVPIGGEYYKFKYEAERLKRATEELAGLVEDFDRVCVRRKLDGKGILTEGEPSEEILRAADAHDLIVMGRDTAFRSEATQETTTTVEYMLKHNPRPIIVTPGRAGRVAPVLVAFDGSIPAARSLQIFTLLQMVRGAEVHIVSVHRTEDGAQALAKRGAAYLKLYGVSPHLHPIASPADAADALLAETTSLKAGLIVMGAFGHRGWREALLGSCTREMIRECPTNLFVHH